jgi:copper(I)-binding protein
MSMFSTAEIFLLVWAGVATIAAAFYHTAFRRASRMAFMAHLMLVGLAKGTAKMDKANATTIFTNSTEESEHEIRIETR